MADVDDDVIRWRAAMEGGGFEAVTGALQEVRGRLTASVEEGGTAAAAAAAAAAIVAQLVDGWVARLKDVEEEEQRDGGVGGRDRSRIAAAVLRFIRGVLPLHESIREGFVGTGLVQWVGVWVRRGDVEGARLLNNYVVGSGPRAREAWGGVVVVQEEEEGEDGGSGDDDGDDDDATTMVPSALVAYLHASIAAAPELGRELVERRSDLLCAVVRSLERRRSVEEGGSDDDEGEQRMQWTMILLRRLVALGHLPAALQAVGRRRPPSARTTERLLLDAVTELLGTDEDAFRVDALSDADLAYLALLAQRPSAPALTCLGTYASKGAHAVPGAVHVATTALRLASPSAAARTATTTRAEGVVDAEEKEATLSALSPALRLLAFAVHRNRAAQDEALRNGETIPLVLSSMGIVRASPLMREWAVLCVRNLTEGNAEVQELIDSYQLQETVPSKLLDDAGLEVYVAPDGKVRVRPRAADDADAVDSRT